MHVQLGQIIKTRYKKTKNPRGFQSSQEQKQGTGHDPCTQHHQGGTNTQVTPWPEPRTHPHPHLICGTGSPTLWSQQGNMLLVFAPS